MLSIKFYNESGNIIFGGGRSDSLWRLTAAEGLAVIEKNVTAVRYAGADGQETVAVVGNPRTITLSGDIRINDSFREEYSADLATLEREGWLEVTSSYGVRKIKARCNDFRQGERKGNYLLFAVQFICDSPYFEDVKQTEKAVFCQIPLLDSEFTFPGAFSKRISKSSLFCEGSAKTEPMFFIKADEGAGGGSILALYNHTGGEAVKFNYNTSEGECITIDIENRKIYNSDGENLLKYLTDDSFFDGFHLYPGINEIEVVNSNMNVGLSVVCRYTNKYSEAVLI